MPSDETGETDSIEAIVLDAMRALNMGRDADHQLDVSPIAPLYSRNSRLDSLGLVALLIEVEEALRDAGFDLSLSDERAMSLHHNPFRDVPSLVEYIRRLLSATDR
jgi:acyl carrier protein